MKTYEQAYQKGLEDRATEYTYFRAALSRCAAVLHRQADGINVSEVERDAALAEADAVLAHDKLLEKAAEKLAEEHKANCRHGLKWRKP